MSGHAIALGTRSPRGCRRAGGASTPLDETPLWGTMAAILNFAL